MKIQNPPPFPDVIDSTKRGDYVSCPTKFFYSFIRLLGSKSPSIDLIAGGAFARGLEVTRKEFYGNKKTEAEALRLGMLAAIVEYGNVIVPEKKEAKSVDRVVMALDYYFQVYPLTTDHVQPYMVNGQPSVEFTFSVPLPIKNPSTGNPICYAGRFDLVGMYQGNLIGVDEKTTSQLGASWGDQWNLRGQFTGYTWALHQYNLPVVGMLVRGISFLKNSFGNQESLQLRPKWMLDQWYEQLLVDVENMLKDYERLWFSQNFSDSCAAYSGCTFQRLCTSATPEAWIEGYYTHRDWNPLAKVPYEQPKVVVETVVDSDFTSFVQRNL